VYSKFCVGCGAEFNINHKFCGKCGKKREEKGRNKYENV